MEASAPLTPEERLDTEVTEAVKGAAKFWWLFLVFGIAWIGIAAVILQFDDASITTVGVIIGAMFMVTSFQSMIAASMVERHGWVYWIFAALFFFAGIMAFISPGNTFAAIADVLGFLFLIVGVAWTIQAFMWKDESDLWWIGLISGLLMIILAFWTAGQFFIEKSYTLLVFAGIWALMHGFTDIVRAFQIRAIGKLL
jgi:uncharacterized membrane protein HdeD (DUF308 family)